MRKKEEEQNYFVKKKLSETNKTYKNIVFVFVFVFN